MGFYYLNSFTLLFLLGIYACAIWIFWLVWSKGLKRSFTGLAVWVSITTILVAPWVEEVWIAYQFGQFCKTAGTFVSKRIGVDGFYDDTHGWRADKLRSSGYAFVEGRDHSSERISYWRHELVGDQVRSFKIAQPTARYHYKWPNRYGSQVARGVVKTETFVIDSLTKQEIARYTSFGRRPPWFWIGLDIPEFACDAPGRWPVTTGNILLYRDALFPKAD